MELIEASRTTWAIRVGLLAILLQVSSDPALAQGAGGMSTLCKFTSGPRAGQVHDYAPMAPIPVGSPCQDGVQSTGVVIAHDADSGGSNSGHSHASSNGMTLTCKFTQGPLAGQTRDYSGVPGARPAPIGSPCTDGRTSNGIAVSPSDASDNASDEPESSPDNSDGSSVSTICQFTYGPKKGGWHDYAPMHPKPVGSSCQDGGPSAGTVVREGQGTEY
jgi:hypothetical protein